MTMPEKRLRAEELVSRRPRPRSGRCAYTDDNPADARRTHLVTWHKLEQRSMELACAFARNVGPGTVIRRWKAVSQSLAAAGTTARPAAELALTDDLHRPARVTVPDLPTWPQHEADVSFECATSGPSAPPLHRPAAARRPVGGRSRLRPRPPQGPSALPDRGLRHGRPPRPAVLGGDRPRLRPRPGPPRGHDRRRPARPRRPPTGPAPGPLRRPAHQPAEPVEWTSALVVVRPRWTGPRRRICICDLNLELDRDP